MKKVKTIEFETEGLKCSVIDDIAVLIISDNIFNHLLDIQRDNELLEWFDLVEESGIKGILIQNRSGILGEDNYAKFLSDVSGINITPDHPGGITKFIKSNVRAVEINMLINFIRKTTGLSKIVISAMQGEVVTPFFGTSLASDFRFVDETTIFLLTHNKYGLHPSGALPFFLPRYVNQGKAMEYLLLGGEITAKQALEMNLVNEILPSQDFQEHCLTKTKEICKMSLQYIKTTKALAGTYRKDLNKYFDLESNCLFC